MQLYNFQTAFQISTQDVATALNGGLTTASNVYAPIAVDWGKLQQFEALLPSLAASGNSADYQTISNQYELSVYHSICPSIMAVVTFYGAEWGSAPTLRTKPKRLGTVPSRQGRTAITAPSVSDSPRLV